MVGALKDHCSKKVFPTPLFLLSNVIINLLYKHSAKHEKLTLFEQWL